MLLGGLWHGAGWTFVIWGGLHGLYLVINHLWQAVVPKRLAASGVYKLAAWAITFLAVVIGWVFFRAPSLDAATNILQGMAGLNGAVLPAAVVRVLPALAAPLQAIGVELGLSGGHAFVQSYSWILACAAIAFLLPNTQQVMVQFQFAPGIGSGASQRRILWQPNLVWATVVALIAMGGILSLSRVSEFLYYQF